MEKNKNKKIKRWKAPFLYFGLKTQAYEFIENLSYFLSSGLSILESLSSLEEETKSFRMRKVISKIKEDVQKGMPLSESFESQKFFEQSTIEIIKAGEFSGKLSENLKLIITLNDEDKKLKSKLNSSLLYGTIILTLTLIVGIGTSWTTLPQLAEIYSKLGSNLPLLTRILIKFGSFIEHYGFFVVPIFLVMIAMILYFLFSFPKTKFIGHLILFHIPFVGKLIKESEITRLGYLMGNISKAGIPINQALAIMPGITTFNNYKKLYRYLAEKVSEGITISESMKLYKNYNKLIPFSVFQMISSAEKSGKLPETFLRISDLYGLKLENTSRNLPIIIEPLLFVLVGIGVTIFVLATMFPIYNLSKVIQ